MLTIELVIAVVGGAVSICAFIYQTKIEILEAIDKRIDPIDCELVRNGEQHQVIDRRLSQVEQDLRLAR